MNFTDALSQHSVDEPGQTIVAAVKTSNPVVVEKLLKSASTVLSENSKTYCVEAKYFTPAPAAKIVYAFVVLLCTP